MTNSHNKCAQCGIVQSGRLTFTIGAKRDVDSPEWVLVEGTGRLVCHVCYPDELERGKELIERYIASHNAQVASFRQ